MLCCLYGLKQMGQIHVQIQAVAVAVAAAHRLLGRQLAVLQPLRRSEESNRPASEACKMRQRMGYDRMDF